MVGLFGTNDKLALELFIVVVALGLGAGLGILARRRYAVAAIGFAAFGVLGFLAALGDPLAEPRHRGAVGGDLGRQSGCWVLGWLLGPARGAAARRCRRRGAPSAERTMPDWSRRSFMIRAGGVGVGAVVAGVAGRNLLERSGPRRPAPDRPSRRRRSTVPAARSGRRTSRRPSPGLTPIVMPNDGSTGSTPRS